jgi:modulator of FtsH protease HflC
MRLNLVGGIVAVLLILVLIVAYGTLFTVYQTRQALVVRLGNPIRVITEPGLHYKMPIFDSVIHIDKRILDLENPAQEVIASDQKRLVVDAFARYRIKDATAISCPSRKSYPGVAMMQPGQDRCGDDSPRSLGGSS